MTTYIILTISVLLNLFFIWYLVKLLRKFIFISENIADLFLTTKAFEIFVKSLYSMDSYHGEPMVQELIFKMKELIEEMESFREIFEYMIDEDLEEELNAAEAQEEE